MPEYCRQKAQTVMLPEAVTVRIEVTRRNIELTCRGTTEALIRSGYLTDFMISARRVRGKGQVLPQLDEDGGRFWMHPSPTKSEPQRMMLVRRMDAQSALKMPNVRDLFPDGIPERQEAVVDDCLAIARAETIDVRGRQLRTKLMKRYPGVSVSVHFNDHMKDGHGTYRGWCVSFEFTDPKLLHRHNLTPGDCNFGSGGISEFAGVHWHTHDIIDDSKQYGVDYHIEVDADEDPRPSPLTARTQSHVMRLLKPFVKGTWKPRATS